MKNLNVTTFTSLKDAAYQQATAVDVLDQVAAYALGHIKGFPENCDKESRAILDQGYRLRRNEISKPLMIVTDNGAEKEISVDLAFSYTSQAFGVLKTTEPALYNGIKQVRDATSNYTCDRYRCLVARAKKLLGDGKESTPRVNLTYAEYVEKRIADDFTRAKQFVAKGNNVDLDAVNRAGIAYRTAMLASIK